MQPRLDVLRACRPAIDQELLPVELDATRIDTAARKALLGLAQFRVPHLEPFGPPGRRRSRTGHRARYGARICAVARVGRKRVAEQAVLIDRGQSARLDAEPVAKRVAVD